MYKRILVPLDGSLLAESAVPHAVAQAECFQAELVLIRVMEPLTESVGKSLPGIDQAEEWTREIACDYIEQVADGVRKVGISVRAEVIEGHPHHKIVEYAQSNDVDLIVISARGRSGISRWLMGSVADRVIRGAEMTVLVVRAAKPVQAKTLH
jgi:nucleotide-binding universal stress UspA family protein